jgi:hypothetical protein
MEKKHKHFSFLIKPDGKKVEVSPKNGEDFSLEELQGYVEGYIQIVNLSKSEVLVINEEGKLKNLPLNKEATFICKFRNAIFANDCIVGNALLCHKSLIK